jgi:hypothetical protein
MIREALLERATQRISSLVDYDSECSGAVPQTMMLLEQIVLDGQPTPQPTYYTRGIEITWLVNDWHVGLLVDDEEWTLWATQPDHAEMFEIQGRPGTRLKPEELRWTQHLLKTMGDQITDTGMWKV